MIRLAIESDLPEIVRIYNQAIPGRMATGDQNFVSVESRKEWYLEHSENRHPIWSRFYSKTWATTAGRPRGTRAWGRRSRSTLTSSKRKGMFRFVFSCEAQILRVLEHSLKRRTTSASHTPPASVLFSERTSSKTS